MTGCGAGAKGDGSPGAAPAKAGPPPAPVVTAVAVAKDVPLELRAIGAVQASSTVTIRSQVTGALIESRFVEGQPVKQGQPLFAIDARPLEQALKQAEADRERSRAAEAQAEAGLARDQAQADYAARQAERYAGLLGQGVTTADQVEQLRAAADAAKATVVADRAAVGTAKAALAADEAAVEAARVQLGYCAIASPIDGVAGMLQVDVGNVVTANQTALVTINRVRPIDVRFSVPEGALAQVRERSAAERLAVTAGPSASGGSWTRAGTLAFIDNQVDQATGTIALRATFPNDDGMLWPGQFVTASLTLGVDRGVVTVPSQAVQTGQKGDYVYVVTAEQTAEARPVTVARLAGPDAVIAKGLAEGEAVVVDGQVRVAPGAKVKPASAAAPSEAKAKQRVAAQGK